MYPTLFTFGRFTITSFGLFLVLAFFASVFITWRIARAYDVDEEKVLDIGFLVGLAGIVGARLYGVLLNPEVFNSIDKVFMLTRYPGMSFWGGLSAGAIVTWILVARTKLGFWHVMDFASVGLALGIAIGDIGCLLGGCIYGLPSGSFLATSIVGVIDKRFPIAILEAVAFLLTFIWLWKQVLRFHFAGKISAVFLILTGLIKFIIENYRGDTYVFAKVIHVQMFGSLTLGQVNSLLLITFGIVLLYIRAKRDVWSDLFSLRLIFTSQKRRKVLYSYVYRTIFNIRVSWQLRILYIVKYLLNLPKNLGLAYRVINGKLKRKLASVQRRLNVKPTPTDFK